MLLLFSIICILSIINGKEVPVGQLLQQLAAYEINHHLPTFPIPFTLPLKTPLKFLYFPKADSAADRDSSILRCRALNGELYEDGDASVREMLACVIGEPIHIKRNANNNNNNNKDDLEDGCWVMLPGGSMVNGKDFCKRQFGSICKL